MADEITITALNEEASASNGDFVILETPGGTRRIQRNNLMPSRGAFTLIDTDNIDILNTRVTVLDASDGRPREVSVRDLVFGNFQNRREIQDFTLTPGTHNVQAVELDEDGSNAVGTITIDGSVTGIAGADFYLVNMRAVNVAVVAANIIMNVEGIAIASTVIGPYRSATITVKNDASRAIFSGG